MTAVTHRTRTTVATLVLLVAGVLWVLIPASPRFQKSTSIDSGVFLYTGWQVTQGALPYRDVWDHKPPLIFAINAVGLWLGNDTRWGVWAIELFSLTAAAVLAFDLLRRAFGRWSAAYVSFAWLLCAFLTMDGGNYTTEYALPLQFGCLWLVATAPRGELTWRRGLAVGVLAALLFWLKENTVAIPVAIALFCLAQLLVTRKRHWLLALLGMSAAFIAVSFVVLFPFLWAGALPQLWSAAVLYNVAYTSQPWLKRLLIVRWVGYYLAPAGLALFTLAGWLLTGWTLFFRRRETAPPNGQSALGRFFGSEEPRGGGALTPMQGAALLTVAWLALPIDVLLLIYPAKTYDHYFLALLPTSAVLAGLAFSVVTGWLRRRVHSPYIVPAFTFGLVVIAVLLAFPNYRSIFTRVTGRDDAEVVNYIDAHSGANDVVLLWGIGTRFLFQARRVSPTRFVYLGPLIRDGYASPEIEQEFLDQVNKRKPGMILDYNADSVTLLQMPFATPALTTQVAQLRSQYQKTDLVGAWTVYQRVGANP